ncbi:ribosome production factor 2 homolog [Dendronephthya gigantea]|uniref:ribosome production factor 2 homolog n=1 Tax=Dendronephthya gigantea TaxID=151771 RepID=UPI001069B537|nr:ribosome production factor 2 homolog [Dendronephthya gigantea]
MAARNALKDIKRAKTHKGRRLLDAKEPKLVENSKTTMFIRGGRTSETVTQALKDLYVLRKPHAVIFKRKNIMRPFEDETSLEFFSNKNDASTFVFGSHSKKRPHNLVIGRFFDGHILDMVELGIENFASLRDFQTEKCAVGTKPCLVFVGEAFDTEPEYVRLKNLLIDVFRGANAEKVRLQGLEHVIQFTELDGKIFLRSYRVLLKKSGTRTPRVELEEIGPSLDLVKRRVKLASDDLWKRAVKKPKTLKPKKTKNISHDPFGSKLANIHMQRQDYSKLQTRKMKGLKRKTENQKDNSRAKRPRKTAKQK